MDLPAFSKAVVVHHKIKNLEKSLRVLEDRSPESLAMEFSSEACAVHVKQVLQTDLSTQLDAAKKELVTILAG